MAEHPKVQAGKNPATTPLDDLTEKDLLLGIYRAANTIRNVVVVFAVLSVIGAIALIAASQGNG